MTQAPVRDASTSSPTSGLRRVVTASMAGTVVEWYEFFLYASAATLVFGTAFFPPSDDPYAGIIAAFLTYAVGFIARPLGGIVFGHFGDKYGRKRLLQLSIILIGVATFLIGCLPTYAQVGLLAPTLLVILRFLQGFALGGEWGGAVLLVAEHSPSKSRGFWASWPQAAVPVGNLLATLVLYVLSSTLSRGGVPRLGLARRVLALGGHRAHRLVHPHEGHRRPDLPRDAGRARGREGDLLRRDRGAQALPARRDHGHGPARRGEHPLLRGRDLLDRLPHAGRQGGHGEHAPPPRRRAPRALPRHPAVGPALRPHRPPAGVRDRGHPGCDVGVLRLPAHEHGPAGRDLARHLARARLPRRDVRGPAGDHGRDVPDPHALLGRLARLPGHVDLRGLARPDHRDEPPRAVRLERAGRDLRRRRLRDHPRRRRGRPARPAGSTSATSTRPTGSASRPRP